MPTRVNSLEQCMFPKYTLQGSKNNASTRCRGRVPSAQISKQALTAMQLRSFHLASKVAIGHKASLECSPCSVLRSRLLVGIKKAGDRVVCSRLGTNTWFERDGLGGRKALVGVHHLKRARHLHSTIGSSAHDPQTSTSGLGIQRGNRWHRFLLLAESSHHGSHWESIHLTLEELKSINSTDDKQKSIEHE